MSNDDEIGPGPGSGFPTTRAGLGPAGHRAMSADGRYCQWRLHSIESAIPRIRRGLRAFLDTAGLSEEETQDLIMAVCEAATNAVEHAQHPDVPFFDLSAEIGCEVVTVVVRDHGAWREPAASPYRGRGLAMMRILADTTVTAGVHGTTVTLRNRVLSHQGSAATEEWAS
jgi:anti-sigma regulatory factor (Ser/Thr protein kinase)